MHWHRTSSPPVPFDEAGDGFPVLLVPGRLSDGRLWSRVADLLSARYRTIRCDLRSERRFVSVTADSASRLLSLLDWIGLDRAHLVAHGSGWSWAAELAVRAPARVASLTVVDPVVPRTEHSNTTQENWHLEMLLQWLSVSHGSTVRKPEHASVLAAVVAQQTHGRIGDADSPFPAPAPSSADLPPLDGIQCPVLALMGEQAPLESKALVASVFGQVRRFRYHLVKGAVRHSPVEAPEAVSDSLHRLYDTYR